MNFFMADYGIYKKPLYETRPITDVRDMLRGSCELYPENNAFLEKRDGVYTPVKYKEYLDDVNALGTKLMDMGLKGEMIAVIGPASYHWALSYMAVLCGVGVIVPLDKELPKEEIIESSEERVIYTLKEDKEQFEVELYDKAVWRLMKQENLITFDKLNSEVAELFASDHIATKPYKLQYKYIFVDEFQDTDEYQIKFLNSFPEFPLSFVATFCCFFIFYHTTISMSITELLHFCYKIVTKNIFSEYIFVFLQ
jgi:acyl-CoA synthetase (AMP-forming)/AMP-acid ligase II